MKAVFRNILAVVAGLIIGSVINMAIVVLGNYIIPAPNGADATTIDGLKASMHLFKPVNFLMPFLAHALGTFTGSLIAALGATNNRKMQLSIIVGIGFLAGGISNVLTLPSPIWFNALDLVVAYIPMSYLAARLVIKKANAQNPQ